ncbi:MAG TPA: Xaa-Pro peptidase family protein [Candidatus Lokiarchaeia archaeon]|nr:Xaa-Pro peptidase family protein [Candidatus Lokiarchaeia archaeon]
MLKDTQKWDRVREILERENLDAIIAKFTENVLYFTNWWPITGWGVAVVFRDRDPVVFVPDTEMDWTKFAIVDDVRPYAPNGNDSVFQQLESLNLSGLRVGIEESVQNLAASHLTYEVQFPSKPFFDGLRDAFPTTTFVDATPIIYEMRRVKTPFEIEQLRLVHEMNAHGMLAAYEACEACSSEMEVQTVFEKATNDAIADHPDKVIFVRALAFVMAGPNGIKASYPYNISTAYRMQAGEFCMIEINTQVNGYWSDLTRTCVVGHHPTPEQEDMFATLNASIDAACAVMVPGCETATAYLACRDVIAQTPYVQYHTPFLGHGIGVKLHETPPLMAATSEGALELGNYVSVEPGLYIPEMGALRIERNAVIRENGAELIDTAHNQL